MAQYITFQPSDYFNTVLYTGNASTNAVTGVGFQPDWLWFKCRTRTDNHRAMDVLRGTNSIIPNTNNAQSDVSGDGFTSIDSDGFTLNGSGGGGEFNANSASFVCWNWKAGGSGSANSNGSISSTVSANTTAGFSIVTYTGTGANATVGHGLGTAPALILFKQTSATQKWIIHHQSIGATKSLHLDTTEVEQTNTFMNNTAPTSTVFSLGTIVNNNTSSENYVAYCFAEKKGFFKAGLYEGNGSTNGAFIYTGFKPAFVILKGKGNTSNWGMHDSARDVDNAVQKGLIANDTNTEDTHDFMDFLSNGFKLRSSSTNRNGSGQGYVYWAFAEEPFVSSNGVPATAR